MTARLGRWTRQHRTLTASGLVALLLVALGTGWVAWEREQARGKIAKEQIETEKQRDSARERLHLALEAYGTLTHGIQQKLEVRPGTQELRVELLKTAQQGLRQLLAATSEKTEGDSTLVWAHLRMGDVALLLADTEQCEREYREGHRLAEAALAADPKNSRAQRDLSVSHIKLGDIHLRLGQTHPALDAYLESLKIDRFAADADPKNSRAQQDLSVSHERLGNVYLRLGQTQSALDAYKESSKIHEALVDVDPSNGEAQRSLSISQCKLGDVYL